MTSARRDLRVQQDPTTRLCHPAARPRGEWRDRERDRPGGRSPDAIARRQVARFIRRWALQVDALVRDLESGRETPLYDGSIATAGDGPYTGYPSMAWTPDSKRSSSGDGGGSTNDASSKQVTESVPSRNASRAGSGARSDRRRPRKFDVKMLVDGGLARGNQVVYQALGISTYGICRMARRAASQAERSRRVLPEWRATVVHVYTTERRDVRHRAVVPARAVKDVW